MEPDRRSANASCLVMGIGLVLTLVLFSGYRPWGLGPVNAVLLLGPVLLAAGAAGHSARARPADAAKGSGGRSPASRVTRLGLLMLLVGGCPWVYTPLFTGGESNSASGMLGTVIFLLVGVPGLAVTAIGLIHWASQRRARRAAKDKDRDVEV